MERTIERIDGYICSVWRNSSKKYNRNHDLPAIICPCRKTIMWHKNDKLFRIFYSKNKINHYVKIGAGGIKCFYDKNIFTYLDFNIFQNNLNARRN
jgi:hypothetical protein